MYISVARDREGQLRIYSNDGSIYTRRVPDADGNKQHSQDDVVHCTSPLTTNNIGTYLKLVMEAIMAWDDPLKVTRWEKVDGLNSPATARNAVGFNATHREIWVLKYDKDGKKRFAELLEAGSRDVIATTFILSLSKLFLMNLDATLDQQSKMEFEPLLAPRVGRPPKEKTNA
jgi:hypothetical protein